MFRSTRWFARPIDAHRKEESVRMIRNAIRYCRLEVSFFPLKVLTSASCSNCGFSDVDFCQIAIKLTFFVENATIVPTIISCRVLEGDSFPQSVHEAWMMLNTLNSAISLLLGPEAGEQQKITK